VLARDADADALVRRAARERLATVASD